MKRRTGVFATTMLLAAMLAGGACTGAGTGTQDTGAAEEQNQALESSTVTFYDSDGSTVLETRQVEAGACVEEFVPEKEGYTFVGW